LSRRLPNVVIIHSRCGANKQGYGIRMEEVEHGRWVADWAFPLKDERARREQYSSGRITGSFSFSDAYPGCSHCGKKAVVYCSCKKVSCWDGETKAIHCPWCGRKSMVSGVAEVLSANSDT